MNAAYDEKYGMGGIIIMYDEVHIRSGVEYVVDDDTVDGIQYGTGKFLTHANVIMARSVHTGVCQPICYDFSAGPMTGDRIATCVEKVIDASMLRAEPFSPVAVVCDAAAPNRKSQEIMTKKYGDEVRDQHNVVE